MYIQCRFLIRLIIISNVRYSICLSTREHNDPKMYNRNTQYGQTGWKKTDWDRKKVIKGTVRKEKVRTPFAAGTKSSVWVPAQGRTESPKNMFSGSLFSGFSSNFRALHHNGRKRTAPYQNVTTSVIHNVGFHQHIRVFQGLVFAPLIVLAGMQTSW